MFEIKTNKDTVHITGELLIQDADAFYNKMEELLEKGSYAHFDLSGVDAIDVSTLQILLSYKKCFPEGSKFSICQASENVGNTIKLIGLAKALQFTG